MTVLVEACRAAWTLRRALLRRFVPVFALMIVVYVVNRLGARAAFDAIRSTSEPSSAIAWAASVFTLLVLIVYFALDSLFLGSVVQIALSDDPAATAKRSWWPDARAWRFAKRMLLVGLLASVGFIAWQYGLTAFIQAFLPEQWNELPQPIPFLIYGLFSPPHPLWLIGVFFAPTLIPILTGHSAPPSAGSGRLWSLFGITVVLVVFEYVAFKGALNGLHSLIDVYLHPSGSMQWLADQIIFLALWFVRSLAFLSVLGMVVARYSRKATSAGLAPATS